MVPASLFHAQSKPAHRFEAIISGTLLIVGVLHRSRGDSKLPTTRLKQTESRYIKREQAGRDKEKVGGTTRLMRRRAKRI
jgi:hypothetical protein